MSEESKLQSKCNKWLRDNNIMHLHLEKGRGVQTTHRKGIPDLIIWLDKGRTVFIELKSQTGKLSPDQNEFFEKALRLGHHVYMINSFDKFLLVMELENK